MKTFTKIVGVVVSCTVLSFSVMAQQKSVEQLSADYCELLNKTALKVMTLRQAGVPLSELLPLFKNEPKDSMIISVIKDAYTIPQYSLESNKAEAVREFANQAYLSCYEGLMEQL